MEPHKLSSVTHLLLLGCKKQRYLSGLSSSEIFCRLTTMHQSCANFQRK